MIGGVTTRAAPVSRLTRLEEASFGYSVLLALAELRKRNFWNETLGPRLFSIHGSREQVESFCQANMEYLCVESEVFAGNQNGLARMFLPQRVVERALHECPDVKADEIPKSLRDANISFWSFVGPCLVPREEFDSLGAGDALVFPNSMHEKRVWGPCRILGSGIEVRACLSEKGLEVQEINTAAVLPEVLMSSTLPVEVEIELAKVRIPIAELSTIRPGAILPLHVTARDFVTLRVGDRPFAQAELVNVEGQIGARIIKMLT
jgi:type III secretion protein Q